MPNNKQSNRDNAIAQERRKRKWKFVVRPSLNGNFRFFAAGGELHHVRVGRRGDTVDAGTRGRHDARGDPRGGASERQDGDKEESAAAAASAAAVVAGGRREGEAGTRGHTTAGRESGPQQERASLLPLLRHQLQLPEHVHRPQKVLLLESRRRGEQQQQ